ncbi:hypothetical protein, partial [Actinomadura sp. CNU-125]|uniref:hypothetical protein n=1 Tax=Actinomadura sp. CNU-125 TaxID=1904961 RepID=UPI0021CC7CEF
AAGLARLLAAAPGTCRSGLWWCRLRPWPPGTGSGRSSRSPPRTSRRGGRPACRSVAALREVAAPSAPLRGRGRTGGAVLAAGAALAVTGAVVDGDGGCGSRAAGRRRCSPA